MFKRLKRFLFPSKYTITILNSKWEIINTQNKLCILPNIDHLLLINGQYYNVLKIIHGLNQKQDIFVIIEKQKDGEEY